MEPVEPEALYLLYTSAVSGGTEKERLVGAFTILGMGRLGLTPGELRHFHDGWIDWKGGVIQVPAHDPCACRQCVQATADERDIEDMDRAASIAVTAR
jgi:hypothetical protein